ncbi:MAG: hypothetical protein CG439_1192 [Methylococcaceae bacterium NSP1-2]|nr:MAG: hypothetical protein CG439_1192 [Methylococcaceae bacterium NSP1-2]
MRKKIVPLLVVLEIIWVLQSAYKISDSEILATLAYLVLKRVESKTLVRVYRCNISKKF